MLQFIVKRFLQAIPTLWVLITLSFFVMHLTPGSPLTTEEIVAPEVMALMAAKYHLDEPLYQQYGRYMKALLQGDFGVSFKYQDRSVSPLIGQAFPVSCKIGGCAFTIALLLGISAGICAALRQNSWVDHGVMLLAMSGVILPNFVKAPLLILIFAVELQWLPAGGWNDGEPLRMILPITTLALAYMASIARITRGSMIDVLHSSFIRTARAKGLPLQQIVWRHALQHFSNEVS